MKDVEKSKRLKEVRDKLGWTQQEMADELGYERTYISDMERGAKPIATWILEKIDILERRPPSENRHLSEVPLPYPRPKPGPSDCIHYLEAFLKTCGGDLGRLGWVYHELQERFPLDKWAKQAASTKAAASLASPSEDVERGRALRSSDAALRHVHESEPPQNIAEPNENKSRPGGESGGS